MSCTKSQLTFEKQHYGCCRESESQLTSKSSHYTKISCMIKVKILMFSAHWDVTNLHGISRKSSKSLAKNAYNIGDYSLFMALIISCVTLKRSDWGLRSEQWLDVFPTFISHNQHTIPIIHLKYVLDGWMNGVLGHFYALSRLNWAGDNLG